MGRAFGAVKRGVLFADQASHLEWCDDRACRRRGAMRELCRTNDLVFLSFAETALRAAGLTPVILDGSMSVLEGSIGAVPRRLMMHDHEASRGKEILAALGVELDGL